jgi:hypothetical protein
MAHREKTALQRLALRLQRETAEVVNLFSDGAAQANRTAHMRMDVVRTRNAWGVAADKDAPALERRTGNGGYFVDALRVRRQRRRSDTLLPPVPLSELPMMKALLVAAEAVALKPKGKKGTTDGVSAIPEPTPRRAQ